MNKIRFDNGYEMAIESSFSGQRHTVVVALEGDNLIGKSHSNIDTVTLIQLMNETRNKKPQLSDEDKITTMRYALARIESLAQANCNMHVDIANEAAQALRLCSFKT